MLKLHLIDSLSACYTAICATNTVILGIVKWCRSGGGGHEVRVIRGPSLAQRLFLVLQMRHFSRRQRLPPAVGQRRLPRVRTHQVTRPKPKPPPSPGKNTAPHRTDGERHSELHSSQTSRSIKHHINVYRTL